MATNTMRNTYLLAFITMMVFTFIGCSDSGGDNQNQSSPTVTPSSLSTFNNNPELEQYLKEQFAKSVFDIGSHGFGGRLPEEDSGDDSAPGADQNSDPGNYTRTNAQEDGVDEADVVKTDGEYFYIAEAETVTMVKKEPPMETVSKVTISGLVNALYIYKDLLVILYTPTDGTGETWPHADPMDDAMLGIPYWIPIRAKVGIAVYNMSNISIPGLVLKTEVDGYLVSSRRVDNKLHIVHQFLPNLPLMDGYYDSSTQDKETVIAANMEKMEAVSLSELVPYFETTDQNGMTSLPSQAVRPDEFYYPEDLDCGGSITTIMTFDLDNPAEKFRSASVVADANIVYASTKALYIASSQWNGWRDSDSRQTVAIHKFDITGDKVAALGGGVIPGWVLNQFSMGEKDDILRVATTSDRLKDDVFISANNVYCLEAKDGRLNLNGSLENLALGEKLYAARFIGDRGYLVTFETVDPLFTLDLSDPTAPRVVGELKVPGYSDYIHPFGENHLITIGKDVRIDNMGTWQQGVQLSIFDITDFSNPQLNDQVIIGDRGTHSEALHNHKAFTFWSDNNLLAVPIDLYVGDQSPGQPWEYGAYKGSGLYVYGITADYEFESMGQINTMDNPDATYPPNQWTRGIFMDEEIFALTPTTVHWAEVNDIENTVQSYPF